MQSPLALHKRTVRTLTIKSLGAYISFLTNILELCSKDEYTLSTLLKNEYTLHIAGWIGSLGFFYYYLLLLHIFAFRLGRCSTVKIESKRDKLLLKTYRFPRVAFNIKFGTFIIYATILPFSLTSGFATLTNSFHLLFRC